MSLLGPYKLMRVNLLSATDRSQIIFPSGSEIELLILKSTVLLKRIATPLELEVPFIIPLGSEKTFGCFSSVCVLETIYHTFLFK